MPTMKDIYLNNLAQTLYPKGYFIERTKTHFKIFGEGKNGRECIGIKIDDYRDYDDEEIKPFYVLNFNYDFYLKLMLKKTKKPRKTNKV